MGEEKKEEKMEEKKEDVEMKTEEKKEEPKKEEETKEEEKKEEEETFEDLGEEPPKVELDDEDKKKHFVAAATKDIHDKQLAKHFGFFTLPAKSEGFDDIKFEWENAAKSEAYLKTWRQGKKITAIIEDLEPGATFKTKLSEFQKAMEDYQAKQKAFKAKGQPKKKKEGDDEEAKEDVDLFELADVCDTGAGEPLFAAFSFEDWALFTLRYEAYLLVTGYKTDVDDDERIGIHETNFGHYY